MTPTKTVPSTQPTSSAPTRKRKKGSSWWQKTAKSVMWWFLSLGLFIGIWELLTALGFVNTLILPPPHAFIAEIANQEQFLAPQIGVERVGGNFVLLTAIVATLKRVLAGLVLGFIAAVGVGGLACYFDLFGKLTLPVITLLAPIAPIAWIPFAIMAFGIGDGAAIFVVFIGIFFLLTLAACRRNTSD